MNCIDRVCSLQCSGAAGVLKSEECWLFPVDGAVMHNSNRALYWISTVPKLFTFISGQDVCPTDELTFNRKCEFVMNHRPQYVFEIVIRRCLESVDSFKQ